MKHLNLLIVGLIGALIITACNGGNPIRSNDAASLMPNLPGYAVANVIDLQQRLSEITGGSALLSGNPALAGAIAVVNQISTCYQQAGAVEGRSYLNLTDPTQLAVVVVVDQKVLTSPVTFAQCAVPSSRRTAAIAGFSPCYFTYSLTKSDKDFYIGFAATNRDTCIAICTAMEGCSGTF